MKPKKTKKPNPSSPIAQVKAARKASREEEIRLHGKPINYKNISVSKKVYNRKRNKADADEAQPYFLLYT